MEDEIRPRLLPGAITAMLALSVTLSKAQETWRSAPLDEPIRQDQTTRYADLATVLVPDLAQTQSGWRGTRFDAAVVDRLDIDAAWPDGLEITNAPIIRFSSEGSLVALFDFGETAGAPDTPAILALYNIQGPTPVLQDLVNVGIDQLTSLGAETRVIDDQTAFIVIDNSHSNSSQTYRIASLYLAVPDQLIPITDVSTFSEALCGLERRQDVGLTLEGHKDQRPNVMVTVRLEDQPTDDEACADAPPPRATEVINVTYQWDESKARYQPDTDALAKLAERNEQRF